MGLPKTLNVDNEKIDFSLHFILESPKSLYNSISKLMLEFDLENTQLTTRDFENIEMLRQALSDIIDHNNRVVFSKILEETGLSEIMSQDNETLDRVLYSTYKNLNTGGIKVRNDQKVK